MILQRRSTFFALLTTLSSIRRPWRRFLSEFAQATEGNTHLEELLILTTGITTAPGLETLVDAINGLAKLSKLRLAVLVDPAVGISRDEVAMSILFSGLARDKVNQIQIVFRENVLELDMPTGGPVERTLDSITSFFSETTSLDLFEINARR